jgi:hypothetical protein
MRAKKAANSSLPPPSPGTSNIQSSELRSSAMNPSMLTAV